MRLKYVVDGLGRKSYHIMVLCSFTESEFMMSDEGSKVSRSSSLCQRGALCH